MREHYCYSNMALLCEGAVLGSMTSTEDRTAYGLQLIWVGRASGIKGWGKKKKKVKKKILFCGNRYIVLLQIMYFPEPLSIFIGYIMMIDKEIYILPIEIKTSMSLEESMVSFIKSVKKLIITSYIYPINCIS